MDKNINIVELKKKKTKAKVTDKIRTQGLEVTDWSFRDLHKASNIYGSSRLVYSIVHLLGALEDGHILSKMEIEAMDLMIATYNIKYKSALAKAMSERKEEF